MNPQLNSIVDVVLDRSPEELIASVFTALVLALGLAGLFLLLRRRVSDTSTLIICLALGFNLVSMALAGAFVRYRFTNGMRTAAQASPPPGSHGPRFGFGGYRGSHFLVSQIMGAADANSDGFLTADEAAEAASQFVNEGSGTGDDAGRLNEDQLRFLVRQRLMTPGSGPSAAALVGPPRPAPTTPDPNPNPAPNSSSGESREQPSWKPREHTPRG